MKPTCEPCGSSDHSTAVDNDKSITDSPICVSPITGPGARSAQPRISKLRRARQVQQA